MGKRGKKASRARHRKYSPFVDRLGLTAVSAFIWHVINVVVAFLIRPKGPN